MTEIAFCNRYNMSTVFSKSTKYGFKMQAAWRSPNRLPTMVHGQAFCIITRKDNREGIWEHAWQVCRLRYMIRHQYPENSQRKKCLIKYSYY